MDYTLLQFANYIYLLTVWLSRFWQAHCPWTGLSAREDKSEGYSTPSHEKSFPFWANKVMHTSLHKLIIRNYWHGKVSVVSQRKLLVAGHLKMPLESYCLVYANLLKFNVKYYCQLSLLGWRMGKWEGEILRKLFCYYNIQKGKKIFNMFSVYMVKHLIYIFFVGLWMGNCYFYLKLFCYYFCQVDYNQV